MTANETSGQSVIKEGTDDKGDNGADNEASNDPLVGEKKGRQKRGGKALVKTKKRDDVERYVKLARSNRGKKKYVTGMSFFTQFPPIFKSIRFQF